MKPVVMSMADFDTWTKIIYSSNADISTHKTFYDAIALGIEYDSPGKFAYSRTSFWFSREEDAVMFALKYIK